MCCDVCVKRGVGREEPEAEDVGAGPAAGAGVAVLDDALEVDADGAAAVVMFSSESLPALCGLAISMFGPPCL